MGDPGGPFTRTAFPLTFVSLHYESRFISSPAPKFPPFPAKKYERGPSLLHYQYGLQREKWKLFWGAWGQREGRELGEQRYFCPQWWFSCDHCQKKKTWELMPLPGVLGRLPVGAVGTRGGRGDCWCRLSLLAGTICFCCWSGGLGMSWGYFHRLQGTGFHKTWCHLVSCGVDGELEEIAWLESFICRCQGSYCWWQLPFIEHKPLCQSA